MKILIIGGSGGTGIQLIQQSLEQGHLLTALLRNPEKFKFEHPHLRVIKGDILDPVRVEDAVVGQDAVISALGHKRFFIPTHILSEGTRNIVAAMEKHGVSRFICITSLGINDSRFRLGLYYTLFVIPIILFFYFRDKSKQEKSIKNSLLNWTIVRPGQLTNGQQRGIYKSGLKVGNYILTKMISRADVAHFLLSQLNDETNFRNTPGIVY